MCPHLKLLTQPPKLEPLDPQTRQLKNRDIFPSSLLPFPHHLLPFCNHESSCHHCYKTLSLRYKHKITAIYQSLFISPFVVSYQLPLLYKPLVFPNCYTSLSSLGYPFLFTNLFFSLSRKLLEGMCSFSSEQTPYGPWSFKKHYLQLRQLKRRRTHLKEARQRKKVVVVKEEIKMKNLKLYMENQTIIEENEKLRKRALLLHKENQELMTQLQKKFSEQNNISN